MTLAPTSTVVSHVWLRELHRQVTAAQSTYFVQTPIGRREQFLEKGEYKKAPNHVLTRRGVIHAYCPVSDTQPEMTLLIDNLNSEAFLAANPVRQATYAHWALTHIHPFSDGNGRVARALASLYLLRAFDVPLLLFADRKDDYFSCLERADEGDYDVLVTHFERRTIDALQWLAEVLEHGAGETLDRVRGRLQALRRALAGDFIEGYDDLGMRVLNYLRKRLMDLATAELPEAMVEWWITSLSQLKLPEPYRPISKGRLRNESPADRDDLDYSGLSIGLRLTDPVDLVERITVRVGVSNQPSGAFAVCVAFEGIAPMFLRFDYLSPDLSAAAELRLDMATLRIMRDAFDRLEGAAEDAMKDQGRLPSIWTSDQIG